MLGMGPANNDQTLGHWVVVGGERTGSNQCGTRRTVSFLAGVRREQPALDSWALVPD